MGECVGNNLGVFWGFAGFQHFWVRFAFWAFFCIYWVSFCALGLFLSFGPFFGFSDFSGFALGTGAIEREVWARVISLVYWLDQSGALLLYAM